MKAFGLIGASALRDGSFVPDLVAAFRCDGWTVSTIRRAPDGFDLDQPGKASYARREAGCREVVLVGDRRLVLMQEFGADPQPDLDAMLARLAPVDVVIAEGFRSAALPTVEVCVPSTGRECRWRTDPRIVALVGDEPVDSPLPRFRVADAAGLAAHLATFLMLQRHT